MANTRIKNATWRMRLKRPAPNASRRYPPFKSSTAARSCSYGLFPWAICFASLSASISRISNPKLPNHSVQRSDSPRSITCSGVEFPKAAFGEADNAIISRHATPDSQFTVPLRSAYLFSRLGTIAKRNAKSATLLGPSRAPALTGQLCVRNKTL